MTAKQLIEELSKMPPEAEVFHLWDGEPHTGIEYVWECKDGSVITSDFGELCYSEEYRPEGAPGQKSEPHWHTPEGGPLVPDPWGVCVTV